MKIQNVSSKSYMLSGKYNTGVKTVQEILNQAQTVEKSVDVGISKEGYKSYRNNLSKLEEYAQTKMPNKENAELLNKSVLNEGRISAELSSLMREFSGKETDKTSDGYVKSLFKAYTALYDEIKKGYLDGTRDLWANESKNGEMAYRQITEAEELADLNEAFTQQSTLIELRSKVSPEMEKAMKTHREMIAKLKGSRLMLEEEEQPEPIIKAEDIKETLKSGKKQFLEKYAMFQNQTEFSKGITDILNTMFQNNIV